MPLLRIRSQNGHREKTGNVCSVLTEVSHCDKINLSLKVQGVLILDKNSSTCTKHCLTRAWCRMFEITYHKRSLWYTCRFFIISFIWLVMPITMYHMFLLTGDILNKKKKTSVLLLAEAAIAWWNQNYKPWILKFVIHKCRKSFRTILQKVLYATVKLLGAMATWGQEFVQPW